MLREVTKLLGVLTINRADVEIFFFRNSFNVVPDAIEPVFAGDTSIVKVLANDKLIEQQASVSNVIDSTLVPFTDDYVVLRSDRYRDIDPEAPPGIYTITYNIFEVGNASTRNMQ